MTQDPEHSIKEGTKSWITRSYCTRGIGVFYHRNAHCDISYSVYVSCSLNLLNSCDTELSRSWSLSCGGNCWTVIERAYTQNYSRQAVPNHFLCCFLITDSASFVIASSSRGSKFRQSRFYS